ncbi:hypothetical protein GCM10022405_18860 [Gibbsiella dentisursi]|uniref:Uncharacterized protein n=1 Tax=Gibbsiella dentisursi TaxID=796890 RepID=A0ABP7L438_9GAMM
MTLQGDIPFHPATQGNNGATASCCVRPNSAGQRRTKLITLGAGSLTQARMFYG